MNAALRLFSFLLLATLFTNCKRELSWSVDNPTNPTTPTNITASVTGRIVDEFNRPVKGATVKAGVSTATTDVNGEFTINNAALLDKRALVKVEKSGYFDGSRTFIARQSHKHYVEIQLMPRTEVGSISGTGGGTINLANGSSITLPANGTVVKSTGAAYTGNVKVAMTWIDPSSPALFRQMPGDLRGIDASNNETGMQSYGMLGVELTGNGGEKLQIASGKQAALKFPIPASMAASAPATIALWSFNDTTGLWKQEGTATKVGSSYEANVSHFSWWNCDIPFNTSASFSATFVDQNGQPLKGYHVVIRTATGQYTGAHGYTDSSGYVTGRVPANEALMLQVEGRYPCFTPIFTQNIGPYTVNSTNNLGSVTVTMSGPGTGTITGTAVNCANNPVTNGYIEVRVGYHMYRTPITNGSFSVTFPTCAATTTATYHVVDLGANQQSAVANATVSQGNNSVGQVAVCGISSLKFINYTIDGVAYTITSPPDFTMGSDSTQGAASMTIMGNSQTPILQSLNFSFLGSLTGANPMQHMYMSNPTWSGTLSPANPLTVNVTEYGPIGGFVAGNFSGSFTVAGVTHTVQCDFRVQRQ